MRASEVPALRILLGASFGICFSLIFSPTLWVFFVFAVIALLFLIIKFQKTAFWIASYSIGLWIGISAKPEQNAPNFPFIPDVSACVEGDVLRVLRSDERGEKVLIRGTIEIAGISTEETRIICSFFGLTLCPKQGNEFMFTENFTNQRKQSYRRIFGRMCTHFRLAQRGLAQRGLARKIRRKYAAKFFLPSQIFRLPLGLTNKKGR